MAINTRKFPSGMTGNTSGSSMGAGIIGEMLTASGNASAATGSDTTIVTLTLTTGVWLVSGSLQSDNGATQTGYNALFYQKNTHAGTFGIDFLFARYSAQQAAGVTFAPRVLIIAEADSNKTTQIRARSITAANTCYGYLTAVRIA